MGKKSRYWWLLCASACACATNPGRSATPKPAPTAAGHDTRAGESPPRHLEASMLAQFQGFLKEQGDIEVPELWSRLHVGEPHAEPLPFEPTSTPYFDDIARELKLTSAERELFQREGVVSIDQRQRYSMGSAYYAIYTRDLPVLVTTDSILHAWHRSFDDAIRQLEVDYFEPLLAAALASASEAAAKSAAGTHDPALLQSLADVDLYFTVARNLLAGSGAPASETQSPERATAGPPGTATSLAVRPGVSDSRAVEELLAKVAALNLELDPQPPTKIYGGERYVDWSQFRPRGHYAEAPLLARYFRCMMWLGRADLGWNLGPAAERHIDAKREHRDALLAVMLLDQSGASARLANVSRIVDFLVGRPDSVSVSDIHDALAAAEFGRLEDSTDPKALARFDAALAKNGARAQQIRSQVVFSPDDPTTPAPLPLVFQVFGQRFALDSFVLANVVFDQIFYRHEKQWRMLPTGLDVMAALGNESAVRLLKPELERWHYVSNLLAARRSVDALPQEAWDATVYGQWLAALRTLDDQADTDAFPHAMRREAWRRKELRTELAS